MLSRALRCCLKRGALKVRPQVAPLLVQQRYGRGQTLALTAADTWRWRMRMDSKNNAHETFWRQMLRYLVSGTPQQVEIGTEKEVYALDDNVNIVADIRDKRFNPVADAHATARVTKPSGAGGRCAVEVYDAEFGEYVRGRIQG